MYQTRLHDTDISRHDTSGFPVGETWGSPHFPPKRILHENVSAALKALVRSRWGRNDPDRPVVVPNSGAQNISLEAARVRQGRNEDRTRRTRPVCPVCPSVSAFFKREAVRLGDDDGSLLGFLHGAVWPKECSDLDSPLSRDVEEAGFRIHTTLPLCRSNSFTSLWSPHLKPAPSHPLICLVAKRLIGPDTFGPCLGFAFGSSHLLNYLLDWPLSERRTGLIGTRPLYQPSRGAGWLMGTRNHELVPP